jgi:hypothetical protein
MNLLNFSRCLPKVRYASCFQVPVPFNLDAKFFFMFPAGFCTQSDYGVESRLVLVSQIARSKGE